MLWVYTVTHQYNAVHSLYTLRTLLSPSLVTPCLSIYSYQRGGQRRRAKSEYAIGSAAMVSAMAVWKCRSREGEVGARGEEVFAVVTSGVHSGLSGERERRGEGV